jgi:hypothetical protein
MIKIFAIVAFAAAGSANAGIITATFNNVSPGSSGQFSLDRGDHWSSTGLAGVFNWTRTGGDHQGLLSEEFTSFCIELQEHISGGRSYDFTVRDVADAPSSMGGMGITKAAQLAELFGRHHPTFSGPLTSTRGTALQLSIWEIVHETSDSLNLNRGRARFRNRNDDAFSLAQAMLGTIDGTGPRASNLMAISLDGAQDQLVPTPGGFAALALGGLCIARRRR